MCQTWDKSSVTIFIIYFRVTSKALLITILDDMLMWWLSKWLTDGDRLNNKYQVIILRINKNPLYLFNDNNNSTQFRPPHPPPSPDQKPTSIETTLNLSNEWIHPQRRHDAQLPNPSTRLAIISIFVIVIYQQQSLLFSRRVRLRTQRVIKNMSLNSSSVD